MVSPTGFTDDTLIEIFAYLPLNSIYKFKCLSKVWLSNLSNPNFITKWFRINRNSLPLPQYHSMTHDDESDKNALKFRIAYPESHSQFMSRNEHLFSFKFIMNNLYLLGSSNGLVLCYSCSKYLVCNPLTQKWVTLPSPPRSKANPFCVNAIFCEYSPSSPSCYKVVRIPKFDVPSKKVDFDVFSSELGVWESFRVSCDEDVAWVWSNFDKVVVLGGVLFLIEDGERMLVYNLNQNNGSDGHRCSLINLPCMEFDYDDEVTFESRIGESEGWVCYARTKQAGGEMTVSVWVLDEVNWKILHKDISVGDILAEMRPQIGEDFSPIKVLGFSPVDRNVVMLGCKHWVRGFNIQTRSFEDLCLDNRHVYHGGGMFMPFVLKPMPTVLPPASWIDT